MKHSDKLKSFTGIKGKYYLQDSSHHFYLTERFQKDGVDVIEEVGDGFVVIRYASDSEGACSVIVPLNFLIVYF